MKSLAVIFVISLTCSGQEDCVGGRDRLYRIHLRDGSERYYCANEVDESLNCLSLRSSQQGATPYVKICNVESYEFGPSPAEDPKQ